MPTDPTKRFVTKENMIEIAQAMKEAYTNQDAFSKVKVGQTELDATVESDTLEVAAGTNVAIATDTKKVTISATDTTYDPAVPSVNGTGGTDGLLSATDKEKLDGIATGAQVNVIEAVKVNGTSLAPTNKTVDVTVTEGSAGVGTLLVNGVTVGVHGLGTAASADVSTSGVSQGEDGLVSGDDVATAISEAMSSTYKPGGSVAPSGVTSALLVAANEGKVYNLTADLEVTSANKALFVEGTESTIVAGTNLVVIEASQDTYRFDVLSGFVDLSGYVLATDLGGLTQSEIDAVIAEL